MEQDVFDIETAAYDMAVDAASEEVKRNKKAIWNVARIKGGIRNDNDCIAFWFRNANKSRFYNQTMD